MSKPKLKTQWDLSQLYKSLNDPQIEKDISSAEKACKAFAVKYRKSTNYLKDESALAKTLKDYEKLSDMPMSLVPMYLHLLLDIDSENQKARALSNLVSQRFQKMSNELVFFDVNLSKISKNLQKKFLKSQRLLKYRYMLEKIFENSKYVLTEPEEKILTLKSLPAHGLWNDVVDKILNKQTVEHKGKQIPVSKASSIIKNLLSQKDRLILHNKILEKYSEIGDIAEAEINAVVIDKKINDELRGLKESYDGTILGYENDKKSVMSLVKTVTDNFTVTKRFYKIKQKMLKLPKLYYSDRAVPAGKNEKKVTFEEAYKTLLDLFNSIDSEFGAILKRFMDKGQIDAYPRVGKRGGAYCSGEHKVPTFILLNHTDSFESLMTFAHEMGHGIHTELAKSQPVFYERYSTSTAEVASTLFESFLFYSQFERLSKEEKIIALHDKIQDDVQTIFRQIACFNFEVEMHKTIREKGNMSKEELAAAMNKHMKSYIGEVELSEKDGYFFVGWPHIRSFFYVYSYAFGQLASKALYEKYKEDKSYIKEIKKFLSAGGSMSPEDIFKSIGVDVTEPDFWKKGIKNIEEDIELLESLVNKQSKK